MKEIKKVREGEREIDRKRGRERDREIVRDGEKVIWRALLIRRQIGTEIERGIEERAERGRKRKSKKESETEKKKRDTENDRGKEKETDRYFYGEQSEKFFNKILRDFCTISDAVIKKMQKC